MKDVAASTPSRTANTRLSHIQAKLPPGAPSSNVGMVHRYPDRIKLSGDDELGEPRVANISSASWTSHFIKCSRLSFFAGRKRSRVIPILSKFDTSEAKVASFPDPLY